MPDTEENSSKKRKRMIRREKRSQILAEGRNKSPLYILAMSIKNGNYGEGKKEPYFWRKHLKMHKKL
jgi:hypothetical protein